MSGRPAGDDGSGVAKALVGVAVGLGTLGLVLVVLVAVGVYAMRNFDPLGDIDFDLCDWPARADVRAVATIDAGNRWRWDGRLATNPVVDGDSVVLSQPGRVRVLDVESGAPRWSVPTRVHDRCDSFLFGDRVPYPGVIGAAGGTVAIVGEGGVITAFDASSGSRAWRAVVPNAAMVAVADVVAVAEEGGAVHGLDRGSGALRWTAPAAPDSGSGLGYRALVAAGPVIGITSVDPVPPTSGPNDGDAPTSPFTTSTVFVDAATGVERWRTPSGALSSFAYDPVSGSLFEYGEQRLLIARDAGSGALRWVAESPFGTLTVDGPVVTLATQADLRNFDVATGVPRGTAPRTAGGRVLATRPDLVLVVLVSSD